MNTEFPIIPPTAWQQDHTGLMVGRYLVLERLGDSFTHHLYLGRSLAGDQEVEIKFMRTDYALLRTERGQCANPYVEQLRLATRLGSHCVIRHFDAGTTSEGQPYLVRQAWPGLMGSDLKTDLPFLGAVSLVVDAAGATAAAHGQGMLYLNPMPENLALAPTDVPDIYTGRVVDLDGIRWDTSPSVPTAPLSPATITPEDFLGLDAGSATDVFHLGALLYELLAGQPIAGSEATTLEALRTAMTGEKTLPLTRLHTLRHDLSEDVDIFLVKCLQRHPSARPRSTAHFLRGLHHLAMCYAEANPRATIPAELWHRLSRRLAEAPSS